VGSLYIAIDYKENVKGRRGSSLYNLVIHCVDADSSSYIQPVIPDGKTGETMMIYNYGDFAEDNLANAKENSAKCIVNTIGVEKPRPYDVYEIEKIADDIEVRKYLGNLMVPYYKTYVPYSSEAGLYDFTVMKYGNEIIIQNDSIDGFTDDIVGKYLILGKDIRISNNENAPFFGKRLLIKKFINAERVSVDNNDQLLNGEYSNCFVQAPIWASHDFSYQNKIIILCGDTLYYTDYTLYKWEKVTMLTDIKPAEFHSKFEETNKELLLSNQNGIFRFRFENNKVFAYIINSDFINTKPQNVSLKIFGFPDSVKKNNSENPFSVAGFSGKTVVGEESITGGQILDGY